MVTSMDCHWENRWEIQKDCSLAMYWANVLVRQTESGTVPGWVHY